MPLGVGRGRHLEEGLLDPVLTEAIETGLPGKAHHGRVESLGDGDHAKRLGVPASPLRRRPQAFHQVLVAVRDQTRGERGLLNRLHVAGGGLQMRAPRLVSRGASVQPGCYSLLRRRNEGISRSVSP